MCLPFILKLSFSELGSHPAYVPRILGGWQFDLRSYLTGAPPQVQLDLALSSRQPRIRFFKLKSAVECICRLVMNLRDLTVHCHLAPVDIKWRLRQLADGNSKSPLHFIPNTP